MAHYIDADRLREKLNKWRDIQPTTVGLPRKATYEAMGVIQTIDHVLYLIDSLQQEQPKLTQVPRIEQEVQKKGWMDYGLLISEIGLHRSNAIDRIKETKERATEIKRNIAPHDLAILGEYLESAGAEIVLCCLQRYCMDFMFTQDEVKEIIQQKQSEFNIPSAGSGAMGTTPPKFKLEVKEQPVEGREEAAENYIAPIENDEGLDYINFNGRDIKDAFIAGAEWGAEHLKR